MTSGGDIDLMGHRHPSENNRPGAGARSHKPGSLLRQEMIRKALKRRLGIGMATNRIR